MSDDKKLLPKIIGTGDLRVGAVAIRRRSPRNPTLASALKQATKAGVAVAGATINPDGSVEVEFGKSGQPGHAAGNEWDKVLRRGQN